MTGGPGGRHLFSVDLDTSSPGGGPRRDPGRERAPAVADLARLKDSSEWGWMEVRPGRRTAAFSRLDALAPGYPVAAQAAHERGFEPVVRPVGGHLAAFHEGALVIDVLGRHPEPSTGIERRFHDFGQALASALVVLGVDARLGAVPDEYCPGRYSVNARGRTKLAGTAQRLNKGAFWLSALVLVSDADPVRDVLAATYPLLGLPLDQESVGSVAGEVPGTAAPDVLAALLPALADLMPVAEGPAEAAADGTLRVPLNGCWETTR